MNAPSNSFLTIVIFLSTFFFYLQFGEYLQSGDTEPAERLPVSILNEMDLDFDEFFERQETLPYQYKSINNRIVSSYSIIPGILNVPVYLFAHKLGLDLKLKKNQLYLSHITATGLSAISVSLLFLILVHFVNLRIAIFFAYIYAFTTNIWSVASQSLWQHAPSLCFLNLGILLLLTKKNYLILLAGIMIGFAVWNRPTNICFAITLIIYLMMADRKSVSFFCIGGTLPVLLMIWYANVYLGSFFEYRNTGVYGISAFNGNFINGLAGTLVSPSRGIFVYTPIFILSIVSLPKFFQQANYTLIKSFLLGSLLLLCINAQWFVWWGGHTYGYRLMIEAIPSLIIALAISTQSGMLLTKFKKLIFTLLLIISLYMQILGVSIYPCGFNKTLLINPESKLWSISKSQPVICSKKLLKIMNF